MIEYKSISKCFPKSLKPVVHNISFNVAPGETLALLGASGSGKSTLLKMLNRLIEPSSGEILLNHQPITQLNPIALRHQIGYAFQGTGLIPHLTVTENIMIIPRLSGMGLKQRKQKALELLNFVKLPEHFAKRYPDELSGGQQQRVGVARALANDADILLMDEPFGALDNVTRDALQDDFLELKQRLNKTVIFVTHDVIEAVRLADRIAILEHGQIAQIGTPSSILKNPASAFITDLFAKPIAHLKAIQQRLQLS